MKRIIISIILFANLLMAQSELPKGEINGKVLDRETLTPLVGVTVQVKNSTIGTSTDLNGNYTLSEITVGNYVLEFKYIGYEPVIITDVIVRSKRQTTVNAELLQSSVELGSIDVSAGYFSNIDAKPTGTVNFSAEEIRRAPGSAGDVSRILFSLASVAKVNDQRNSLIVRGGSPVENSFYIDNIEIPNINHFPSQGSSDGPIGILNVDFVKDVNFYTGGFSSSYGDRLSSIMDISFREGNPREINPQVALTMAGVNASIEGPIDGGKGNYMFSVSRSYLDIIIDMIMKNMPLPQYGDVQGKVVYNLSDKHKLTLLNILSIDYINFQYEKAYEEGQKVYGVTNVKSNTAGLTWQYIWNNNGYSLTSISNTYMDFRGDWMQTKTQNSLYFNNSIENQFNLRNVNYFKINNANKIEFGFEAKYIKNKFVFDYSSYIDEYGNMTIPLLVNKNMNTLKAGAFFTYNFSPVDYLTFSAGLRYDYFEYNKRSTISPRFSIALKLDDATTLTASTGFYNQNIPTNILAQGDSFKDLKTPTAAQYILGFSRLLSEDTRLTIEAYYKDYSNFPVDPSQPNIFLFDEVVQREIFLNHNQLVDGGKADAKGIEIMIQKKLAKDFYGLASVSYSKSRYRDLAGVWRERVYDNRINFTIEGGYKPNEKWEFSARWIYAGGVPYTPFDVTASTANKTAIYDLSKVNSVRMPAYHSLNVRVDRRFNFESTNLVVYLSVWNAYNRKNIAQYTWNEMKNEQNEMLQWSLLPVLGIEFEF